MQDPKAATLNTLFYWQFIIKVKTHINESFKLFRHLQNSTLQTKVQTLTHRLSLQESLITVLNGMSHVRGGSIHTSCIFDCVKLLPSISQRVHYVERRDGVSHFDA